MGWKSDKDGNHFNGDKRKRDVSDSSGTEINVEIDNNSDDFSEGVKKDFERRRDGIPKNQRIWPKEGFHENFLREKGIESNYKRLLKNWTEKELRSDEGDGKAIIFTNKKHPEYTVEMHPMDEISDDDSDNPDVVYYNAWYMFPAKNGKGIPSSPIVVSETGGYNRDDAVLELKKLLIDFNTDLE